MKNIITLILAILSISAIAQEDFTSFRITKESIDGGEYVDSYIRQVGILQEKDVEVQLYDSTQVETKLYQKSMESVKYYKDKLESDIQNNELRQKQIAAFDKVDYNYSKFFEGDLKYGKRKKQNKHYLVEVQQILDSIGSTNRSLSILLRDNRLLQTSSLGEVANSYAGTKVAGNMSVPSQTALEETYNLIKPYLDKQRPSLYKVDSTSYKQALEKVNMVPQYEWKYKESGSELVTVKCFEQFDKENIYDLIGNYEEINFEFDSKYAEYSKYVSYFSFQPGEVVKNIETGKIYLMPYSFRFSACISASNDKYKELLASKGYTTTIQDGRTVINASKNVLFNRYVREAIDKGNFNIINEIASSVEKFQQLANTADKQTEYILNSGNAWTSGLLTHEKYVEWKNATIKGDQIYKKILELPHAYQDGFPIIYDHIRVNESGNRTSIDKWNDAIGAIKVSKRLIGI